LDAKEMLLHLGVFWKVGAQGARLLFLEFPAHILRQLLSEKVKLFSSQTKLNL
jgi:hypothetical protein